MGNVDFLPAQMILSHVLGKLYIIYEAILATYKNKEELLNEEVDAAIKEGIRRIV